MRWGWPERAPEIRWDEEGRALGHGGKGWRCAEWRKHSGDAMGRDAMGLVGMARGGRGGMLCQGPGGAEGPDNLPHSPLTCSAPAAPADLPLHPRRRRARLGPLPPRCPWLGPAPPDTVRRGAARHGAPPRPPGSAAACFLINTAGGVTSRGRAGPDRATTPGTAPRSPPGPGSAPFGSSPAPTGSPPPPGTRRDDADAATPCPRAAAQSCWR